jgi:hypothetical protein
MSDWVDSAFNGACVLLTVAMTVSFLWWLNSFGHWKGFLY